MNLDLTGLDEIAAPAAGAPLMASLDAIDFDPNQPRKRIDEPTLLELAESIRAIGVVQPVSLRPDAATPGRYIVNYGERRVRAARIAGLREIPAFVHRMPNSYTQVAENLHHVDLSPMEMALFIKSRLDAGEKRNEIAAKLGYKKSYVTEHLALLESPPCVELAYASGVVSARTLYDLRRLHDEFPQQVDAWCASGVEVTREGIAALAEKVRHDEQIVVAGGVVGVDDVGDVEPVAPQDGRKDRAVATAAGTAAGVDTSAVTASVAAEQSRDDSHASTNTVRLKSVDAQRPARQQDGRLRIKVVHCGRSAVVEDDSVVHIRYEDGERAEIRLADVVVVAAVAA